eukprot:jgi/Sobl393_1/8434/SZX78173.1
MRRSTILTQLHSAATALLLLLAASCADAQLICDGNRHVLDTPIAPFPTESTFFHPITTPSGLSCNRKDQPLDATDVALAENQFCGGRASFTCSEAGSTFGPIGPVTHGTGGVSGSPEAVIPPSNPIIYSLTDSPAQAFLTFVRFTVVDVGTAGAKLGGVYGSDPSKAPDVVTAHNWTVNGDQGEPLRCGACSDCREGFGVVPMTVEAAPGAGFRALQLSALFEDARCGGSCRDSDGMYWSGMEYTCVRPTCADADLNSPGLQPFDCAVLGLAAIPGTGSLQNPASDVCCQPQPAPCPSPSPTPPPASPSPAPPASITCASSNEAGERFPCPDGFAYIADSGPLPASIDNCCACIPSHFIHPGLHFGKFGKFKGAGCVKPPTSQPPTPPGPEPNDEKVIQLGPLTIVKQRGTPFQVLPFPFPFFGRR